MKPKKMHAFNKENGVGEFWEFFDVSEGDIFEIQRVQSEAVSCDIGTKKVCFQSVMDEIHALE